MVEEKFFDMLKERIKNNFEKAGSHGFDHTERVYNLAVKIGKDEEVDIDVIKAAALLHDIARQGEEDGKVKCHAEEGAKIAEEMLNKLDFPKDKIEKVTYAIKVHRYSKGIKPETKEAAVIQDADRLDALGAICIARVFSYGGKKGRPLYDTAIPPKKVYESDATTSINHFYEKILNIKPQTFNTRSAQEIAKERYQFVSEFVSRFIKEWNGAL